jgi:4-amino-4-deoxy-L-arabinose transferase-like glycosyltransferase
MKKISVLTYILIISTCIAVFSFSLNLDSWKFSYVGDEWTFYSFAKNIVAQHFLVNPFSMQGVYGENPLFGSVYQAMFLQLFGDTNFAWRFSNIFLIIPCSIFFFLWLKKLFSPQVAFLSTFLLQSSFFASNYFKIGYVNPLSFTFFLVSLYAATLVAEAPTKKRMILFGASLGISFYIYLGPIFLFFIWPLLIPLVRDKKQVFKNTIYFLLSYILLILPGIFDMTHWNAAAKKTIFIKEFHDNTQIVINIFHNFLLYYKNYDYLYNHFIAGGYLDPITAFFTVIGIGIILWNIKKTNYRILLFTYISVAIVIGFTSPYAYTATTRGIFFIPFGCIFAGIALTFFLQKKLYLFFLIPILITIFVLNIYESQFGVFKKTGYTATALIIKEMQTAKNSKDNNLFLLLGDQNRFSTNTLPLMQEAYDLETVNFKVISHDQLNCDTLRNSTTLFFRSDQTAQQNAKSLYCPQQDNVYFKELSPDIFL